MGRVNWVQARAECNLDAVFDALILVVKSDVDAVNSVDDKAREGFRFRAVPGDNGCIEVQKCTQGLDVVASVEFEKDPDSLSIDVHLDRNLLFSVCPRWNEESCSCDLSIGTEVLELWQISRRALESFFFHV